MKYNNRFTFLFMLLAAFALILVACQSTPAAEDTAVPAAEEEAEEAAPVEEEAAAENVRVALVLDGQIDDQGWNQAAYEGLLNAEEEYGVEIAYSEEVPIPDYERA